MDSLDSVVDKINQRTADTPVFYLSNDPERAMGLEQLIMNYHVACIDNTQYESYFKSVGTKFFCLDDLRADGVYRSSGKLIISPEFKEYFEHYSNINNYFQTFKISSLFEFQTKKLGAVVLNTTSALNRRFEDKISQFEELKNLDIKLPKSFVSELESVQFKNVAFDPRDGFVIQFDRGHTGSGTVFIKDEKELIELKKKFPKRHVKVSELIKGCAYTLNCCVGRNGIYMGGLSAQITGVSLLTPNIGGTVGNDWSYRKDLVKGLEGIKHDVQIIGEHMKRNGYKGMFGVDLIIDEKGDHKVIEINARQPASIPIYTKMQLAEGQIPLAAIHLMEFMEIDYEIDSEKYNEINLAAKPYSQVFMRPEKAIIINNEVSMGVYALRGDGSNCKMFLDENKDQGLAFLHEGYTVADIQEGGFLVLTQKLGRKIKLNGEMFRIQFKQGVLDESGRLFTWVESIFLALKDYQL